MKIKIINILSQLFSSKYNEIVNSIFKKVSEISCNLVIKIISKFKFFKVDIKKNIILLFIFVIASSLHPLIAQSINPSQESISINSINLKISGHSREHPSDLFNQGQSFYNTGKFDESVQAWQQASEFYQQQDDAISLSTTLNNLSLAYQALEQWQLAETSVNRSLQIAKSISPQTDASQREIARALDTKGRLALLVGNPENALDLWKQAAILHNQLGDFHNQTRNTLNQEQALKSQGFYRRSLQTLEDLLPKLQTQPDSLLKAIALSHYGEILSLTGDISLARQQLEESFQILQSLPDSTSLEINEQKSIVLLNLGNLERVDDNLSLAMDLYNQSTEVGQKPITKLQGKLNLLSLAIESEKLDSALEILPQISTKLANLSVSDAGIRACINYAESILKLSQLLPKPEYLALQTDAAKVLAKAVKQSQSIKSQPLLAYSLGGLASVYEQAQQVNEAIELTEQAIAISQSINAPDIAYRWQWQLGRILKSQGKILQAIAAYHEAVNTLTSIRGDLVSSNTDLQFSFRDSVEPVYRQLTALLLTTDNGKPVSADNLKAARKVIESLQIAELDNFFKEACLVTRATQIEDIDPQSAVIYPIVLPDSLEVIISLPDRSLFHQSTKISQVELEKLLNELRRSLRRTALETDIQKASQKIYNILLGEKAISAFVANKVKTLAFVLDGSLRNLPMSVLYDGNQYLMEKYNLAIAPGLQLIDPRPLKQQQLEVFIGGVSKETQNFKSLPNVEREIRQISSIVSSQSPLMNETFLSSSIKKQINKIPFRVVHLATHGEFSSDAEKTFILTWDNRLGVKDLGELLQAKEQDSRSPIELLVLSACKTAKGDKRATLGLAGVAVRSGARSTIASLWSVEDSATATLMENFYQELAIAGTTKADALRKAQMRLLRQPQYTHPFYWAPFVLVGNWL